MVQELNVCTVVSLLYLYAQFVFGHAFDVGIESGVQYYIMPVLPKHLVQELNVYTVMPLLYLCALFVFGHAFDVGVEV